MEVTDLADSRSVSLVSPLHLDALVLWPTASDRKCFRILTHEVFGPSFDDEAADELLDFAGARFDEADAWLEWTERELWDLLTKAADHARWLRQLFGGSVPDGWTLPDKAADKPHIRHPLRRAAMTLDKPDYLPGRRSMRVQSLLEDAVAGQELEQWQKQLDAIVEICDRASDEVSPHWRPRLKRQSAGAKGRAQAWPDPVMAVLDRFELRHTQGRKGVPPPLIALIARVADEWRAARGKLPPLVRPPSYSRDSAQFAGILRSLEKAHCRSADELSMAAVEKAISACRHGKPKKPDSTPEI